jgi:N-formylglutamate deformylase
MDDYITINLDGETRFIAAALHNGHSVSENIIDLLAINESDRFREEDPFTGLWTHIGGNRIIATHSRFEFDLNRPPEKAVYFTHSDAWGIHVWKRMPSR